MKQKTITSILLFMLTIYSLISASQVYDVLLLESFDNTTNITTTATSFGGTTSGTCGNNNIFNVSSDQNILGCVNFENGSIFACVDKDAAGVGTTNPLEIELLTYTADHNDEIGFAGNFAAFAGNDTETSDIVTILYSTDNGISYTSALTLTGNGASGLNKDLTGESFTCSDGTGNIHQDFNTKEFSIGSNLNGQTIKIKVQFTGFTSGSEGIALDEFRLVRVRNILAIENFDNNNSLSTTNNTFVVASEHSTCGNNSIYDVTSNMSTPSLAYNCVQGEDGDFFIMTKRPAGIISGEELELLSYTATDNKEISFRGNFSSFADDQNSDNNIVVSYSTDNGSTYNTGLIITGIDLGTDYHSPSDGSPTIGKAFITKGFSIGSNLSGQTIKIKVTFTNYTNGGDGIALDKFILEGSLDGVLPITLINFTPKKVENGVLIDWSTSTEINNNYFNVEKSFDGINFSSIAKIKGAGNSSHVQNYSYFDMDFTNLNDVIYYRLIQTDFDGKSSYSEIKAIKLLPKMESTWNLFPNPSNYILHLDGNISSIKIYDMTGILIYNDPNFNGSPIETAKYPSGNYIIEAKLTNQEVERKRLSIYH